MCFNIMCNSHEQVNPTNEEMNITSLHEASHTNCIRMRKYIHVVM